MATTADAHTAQQLHSMHSLFWQDANPLPPNGMSLHSQIIKLGEGTYGEAFKAPSSGVVFKLVPMEGDNLINGYEQKKAGDLLAEAIIASTLTALSEECDHTGGAQFQSCSNAGYTPGWMSSKPIAACSAPVVHVCTFCITPA